MVFDDKILAENLSLTTNRGYWSVADKFFFNKAECLRYATSLKRPDVRYHYMDSAYTSLNWNVEPKETIEELYKLRAQQIRSKYDYLFLFFSGGSDSTNILDTFMDNNIQIDEVVSCYPLSVIDKTIDDFNPENKDRSNIMFEYVYAAQPKLKELKKRYPNTKITVVDYTEFAGNFILDGNLNKVFQGGIAADPYHISHHYVARQMQKIAETKTVCAIAGIDKPRLMYDIHTDKFGCFFHDFTTIFGNFSNSSLDGYIPDIENFYYSSLFPTIVQKQCFMLKHKLKEKGMTNFVSAKDITKKNKDNRYIIYESHSSFFRSVIYPKWNDKTWQAEKDGINYFFQSNGKWYHLNQFTDKRDRDYYEGQVNELVHGIDDGFLEKTNGKVNKMIDFFSMPIWF